MATKKTLQQLFIQFLHESEYTSRLRERTIKGYKEVFTLMLSVMPEITGLEFLTSEMISEFFKRLQTRKRIVGKDTMKQGIKESTVKAYWSKLSPFLKWLVNKDYLQSNPLDDLQAPEVRYEDIKILSEEEIRKLYTGVTIHAHNTLVLRRDILIISIFFFTGIRHNEFLSLEMLDVDLKQNELIVKGKTSKSKKTRVIPLHPTLILHIKDYIKERNKAQYKTPYLIVSLNKDERLTAHGLQHWVKRTVLKSGTKFHIHQFRHTFACRLAMNNVGAIKIQKLLGHSSIEMTMTYMRSINSTELKKDIMKLSI